MRSESFTIHTCFSLKTQAAWRAYRLRKRSITSAAPPHPVTKSKEAPSQPKAAGTGKATGYLGQRSSPPVSPPYGGRKLVSVWPRASRDASSSRRAARAGDRGSSSGGGRRTSMPGGSSSGSSRGGGGNRSIRRRSTGDGAPAERVASLGGGLGGDDGDVDLQREDSSGQRRASFPGFAAGGDSPRRGR